MPINTREIINVVSDLAREENIQICIKESIKGGIITGIAATVGGVALGPMGLAIGGLFGGLAAANTAKSFKPVAEILINDLNAAQQALLINRVNAIIHDINPSDVMQLTAILISNQSIRNSVIFAVRDFVRNDLNLPLV